MRVSAEADLCMFICMFIFSRPLCAFLWFNDLCHEPPIGYLFRFYNSYHFLCHFSLSLLALQIQLSEAMCFWYERIQPRVDTILLYLFLSLVPFTRSLVVDIPFLLQIKPPLPFPYHSTAILKPLRFSFMALLRFLVKPDTSRHSP